ncbi:hypothetical protein KFE96_14455 [Kordiimonas sp. SCSIO 12603]|uniref:hypothetical protein n=1 Tax=Kordiimonas sp. SCSIO 12603 TaxID=2829596 RepID=UPI002104AAF6|nr:hypothetical protein [Kordiimonas sp. SCSIO 12603]UTW58013.1 hypothetical protein KFE96_14455 [Kordiimonas sp. SCSIO 12603]
MNRYLLIAAALNFSAAFTHLLIIYFGAPWYRFFGAGEQMAKLAEEGSNYPTFITLFIAGVLSAFGLYALAGAGVNIKLPLVKYALAGITAIFLLRALALIPVFRPEEQLPSPAFWTWSSLIVLVFGLIHLIGLKQTWHSL